LLAFSASLLLHFSNEKNQLPLPPGTFPTLWEAKEKFLSTYFHDHPGYYSTGDAGYLDEDGYIYVMTRTEYVKCIHICTDLLILHRSACSDVINVAGHRLTTGQLEEVLCAHPDVAESAVVGAHDDLKGEVPVGLLVIKVNNNTTLVTLGFPHPQVTHSPSSQSFNRLE